MNFDLDLDDEDAFLASLGGVMAKQAEAGIRVGEAEDEPEPVHMGIQVVRRKIVEPKPEPVPYEKPELTKRLCVVDLETDPFKYKRKPEPFSCGFLVEDDEYIDFWGDDAVDQFFAHLFEVREKYLARGEELVIYAHNGGKFDFNYFDPYLDYGTRPFLINGRKVKMSYAGVEFRDSLSILPVALAKLKTEKFAKLSIEYWKMERLFREQYKAEILHYQMLDCQTLLDVVRNFIDRFGWQITIASTALPILESYHGIAHMNPEQDKLIRPFYKGGRVQCFKTGIHFGHFKMIDENSAYPAAMRNFEHPVSAMPRRLKDWEDPKAAFAIIEADNFGCLGSGEGFAFDFTRKRGTFFASVHEIRAGIETATLNVRKIKAVWGFEHWSKFDRFVDQHYGERVVARGEGDTMTVEFMKLLMNSPYGKLCMNTSGYKEYYAGEDAPFPRYSSQLVFEEDALGNRTCIASPTGWRPEVETDDLRIWSRPKVGAGQRFINVAAGASITGAARSVLWRAICAADDPIYCDTDSIICRGFSGDLDESRLGAWKVEAEGDAVCIAGKKLYAFLSLDKPAKESEEVEIEGRTYYMVKKAHKGVQLSTAEVVDVCQGREVLAENMAPTWKLNGAVSFVHRRIKMTAGEAQQLDMFEGVG